MLEESPQTSESLNCVDNFPSTAGSRKSASNPASASLSMKIIVMLRPLFTRFIKLACLAVLWSVSPQIILDAGSLAQDPGRESNLKRATSASTVVAEDIGKISLG